MLTVSRQPAAPDASVEEQERRLRRTALRGGVIMRAEMSGSKGRDVVVGFADRARSVGALERAIAQVRDDDRARLVVVHASSSPIAVHNGPSAEVAESMGEPTWATVYSTVLELGAVAERTLTVIEPGEPLSVIARHCTDASVLFLGPSSRRRFRRRPDLGHRLRATIDCPVVQVPTAVLPPDSRSPGRSRYLPIQAGVTS